MSWLLWRELLPQDWDASLLLKILTSTWFKSQGTQWYHFTFSGVLHQGPPFSPLCPPKPQRLRAGLVCTGSIPKGCCFCKKQPHAFPFLSLTVLFKKTKKKKTGWMEISAPSIRVSSFQAANIDPGAKKGQEKGTCTPIISFGRNRSRSLRKAWRDNWYSSTDSPAWTQMGEHERDSSISFRN